MDSGMELERAATRITAETVGGTIVYLMDRNENRKWRRSSEPQVAPRDLRSCLARTIPQQAQELTPMN